MKWLMYAIFNALYFIVTLFGLGPVLFADGSNQEKMMTLGFVILIYVILSIVFMRWMIKNQMNTWLIYPAFVFILLVVIFFNGS